mmetsp:Transcript_56062/g.155231  ORF Transcript_56062/g.155231 Transcript_56062/m.155231 type:complete len:238 (-) Transcript_56062:313-1026(-)
MLRLRNATATRHTCEVAALLVHHILRARSVLPDGHAGHGAALLCHAHALADGPTTGNRPDLGRLLHSVGLCAVVPAHGESPVLIDLLHGGTAPAPVLEARLHLAASAEERGVLGRRGCCGRLAADRIRSAGFRPSGRSGGCGCCHYCLGRLLAGQHHDAPEVQQQLRLLAVGLVAHRVPRQPRVEAEGQDGGGAPGALAGERPLGDAAADEVLAPFQVLLVRDGRGVQHKALQVAQR